MNMIVRVKYTKQGFDHTLFLFILDLLSFSWCIDDKETWLCFVCLTDSLMVSRFQDLDSEEKGAL